MAPNPIMLSRAQAQQVTSSHTPSSSRTSHTSPSLTTPLLSTALVLLLSTTVSWSRRWILSGAAIESLVIIYGHSSNHRIFPAIPLWTVLATLNLIYAVCSTSWLLYGVFAAICYPSILLSSLFQFSYVADFARRGLRRLLGELHFTKDKIAFFNLPALEIDVDVDGLMVLRGITVHLSTLTVVVHGVELGLKLAEDIELSCYADEVKISLLRSIEVGEVFGNVKGGKSEMTFAELEDAEDEDAASEEVFLDNTPLLRAATAGSEKFKDRPKLRESLTGVSYMRDSTAQSGLDSVTTLSPDDDVAEKRYHEILTEIRTSSTVYQSRAQARKKAKGTNGFTLDDEKDMRAAICAELHTMPSIAHPPEKSIRVSTLQQLSPPHVRRFLHRLPFLLRLLLAIVSYFHSISFASISMAGSGQWLSALLQQEVFKQYTKHSADLRRLERRVSAWLANANFCLQLTGIDGLGWVPLSTNFDITAYLKFYDIMAYRTVPEEGTISQVVRLGGADATVGIPAFLLPHHEHLVPPEPTQEEKDEMKSEVDHADGKPKTKQAEKELEQLEKDETNISISVHASLPASFDQSLLNFVAALVKATKMIELEREVDEGGDHEKHGRSRADSTATTNTTSSAAAGVATAVDTPLANSPTGSSFSIGSTSDDLTSGLTRSATTPVPSSPSPSSSSILGHHERKDSGFKTFAKSVHLNLKQSTTVANTNLREFVTTIGQKTSDGMKKAVVGGMVNDRWIAKLVGKAAASLQNLQGDIGYSGKIPVALKGYRAREGLESKLLP